MTQLPQLAYHAPALVRLVMSELDEDDLALGVEIDRVHAALVSSRSTVNPCLILLALLTSGDFATLPKLRVRAVRPRYSPMADIMHLSECDGVVVYSDECSMRGDEVLMRLQACAVDARSALRHALISDPNISRADAWLAVCRVCPRVSRRSFDHDWLQARLDVGLPARGRAGRPKKATAAG